MNRKLYLGFAILVSLCSLQYFPTMTLGHDEVQVVVRAPQKDSFTKLPEQFSQKDGYGWPIRGNVGLSIDGWICTDTVAETTITTIQRLNKMTSDVVKFQNAISAAIKTLMDMEQKQQKPLELQFKKSVITKSIRDTVVVLNYYDESSLIDRAADEAGRILEKKKENLRNFFYLWGVAPEGQLRTDYGSNAWGKEAKLWKMDAEGYSVVYVLQNCYQKNDLEAMMNAQISAAEKLKIETDNYKEFKEAALEWRLSFGTK